MGIFKKKNKKAETNPDRKYGESLDYFEELDEEGMISCPQCAKEQKHVKLVKSEGRQYECPECHYLREVRRI